MSSRIRQRVKVQNMVLDGGNVFGVAADPTHAYPVSENHTSPNALSTKCDTHTDQELPANQQQAAPSTEVRTQVLST